MFLSHEVQAKPSSDDSTAAILIRTENAYPGAANTVGSVHQRQWFLTLDKPSSGFVRPPSGPRRGQWVRGPAVGTEGRRDSKTLGRRDSKDNATDDEKSGFEPFFVRGPEVERSVVTGRTADEIMADEGVEGFVRRNKWRVVDELKG